MHSNPDTRLLPMRQRDYLMNSGKRYQLAGMLSNGYHAEHAKLLGHTESDRFTLVGDLGTQAGRRKNSNQGPLQ